MPGQSKSSDAWLLFGAVFIESLGSPTNQLRTRLVNEVLLAAGGGAAGGGAAGGGAVVDALAGAPALACAPGGAGGAPGAGCTVAVAGPAGCVGNVSEPVSPVKYEQPVHAVSAMIAAMVVRKLPTPCPRRPSVPEMPINLAA